MKTCTRCAKEKLLEDFPKKLDKRASRCKKCSSELTRERRLADPERAKRLERERLSNPEKYAAKLARSRKWYLENQEYNVQRSLKYTKENPDKIKGNTQRWRAKNPERSKELSDLHGNLRRARLANVDHEDGVTKLSLSKIYGWVCYLCTKEIDCSIRWPNPLSATIEHLIPIVNGGGHTFQNTNLAHLSCNLKKGTKCLTSNLDVNLQ